MRLLFILFFVASISYSQTGNKTVIKKDGTELIAKRTNSNFKKLKVVLDSGKVIEMPYNQLDRIEYYVKVKREKVLVKDEFVRISKRNGAIMRLVVDGKCKMYQILGGSGGLNYYAKREGEAIATLLGTNTTISLGGYKDEALNYFKDCPATIARINKKFRRKKIDELVTFYNENCE